MGRMNVSAASPAYHLDRLRPAQWREAARLIHSSLVSYYGRHLNQPDRFGSAWEPFLAFPEIYESMDPGCGVTAVETGTGRLLGVCFYHPRETHIAVGIVSTLPEAAGRGVAGAMMREVLAVADGRGQPARLVSSAMTLDSFSLYTRLGFTPRQLFQDMIIPAERIKAEPPPPGWERVRPAEPRDAAAMADLEHALHGIRRESDYRYFLENREGFWRVKVLEGEEGGLRGFLCGVHSSGPNMLGPGVMADEEGALALIHAMLRDWPADPPVFLVPARASELVARLYRWGARNLELHLSQGRGEFPEMSGVCMPTFMPETG